MVDIPDEYLDNDHDFGFTFADSDGDDTPPPVVVEPQEITVELPEALEQKLTDIDGKLGSIITMHEESKPDFSDAVDFARLEEKIDTIVQLEQGELSEMLESQTTNIQAIINEVDERRGELEEEWSDKCKTIEALVLPLLYNLMKNPDKEYILWPNRVEVIQKQIQRLLEVTKS